MEDPQPDEVGVTSATITVTRRLHVEATNQEDQDVNRDDLIETITYWASRIVCHFGIHTLACRGRVDHDPNQGRWIDRW